MQIKILKKKNSFKKKSSQPNPDMYWKSSVLAVFVLTVLSLAFGYYLFMQINQESTLASNNGGHFETVKKDNIEKVLKYFSDREIKSNEILNSPAPVTDPSL